MYRRYFKRGIDFIAAVFGIIISFPLFLFVSLLLAVANRGHVFFLQPRPGKDERIFKVIKFKTMNDRRDADGGLLPDGERLTGVGRFVRSTSLDELPQLLNVFLGDMSIVGPRPLLVKYLPYYTVQERIRHCVRPGITGWAQVNGRNTVNWDARLAMDAWYVDHLNFLLDMKILALTVQKVFKRENITVDTGTLEFKNLDDERRN